MNKKGKHHNKYSLKNSKRTTAIIFAFCVMIFIIFVFNINNIIAYFTKTVSAQNVFTIQAEYTVSFNGNGGTGTMNNQVISYNELTPLDLNSFSYSGYAFSGWNTESDGTGTSYADGQSVENLGDVTLYAQWTSTAEIAEVNGTRYTSLQAAVSSVLANDVATTVTLLQDTSEEITVNAHQNIVFNFQNYTVSNKDSNSNVIINYGCISMSNGTITTNAVPGAVNNYQGGTFIMSGGRIIATGTKQAIFNDGGSLLITGSAYLSSTSTQRGAVTNSSSGTVAITGGTIISTGHSGVVNSATIIIGTEDGDNNPSSLVIQGAKYGIETSIDLGFFDGTIKGKNGPIDNPGRIVSIETGYDKVETTERIGGVTYTDLFLGRIYTVTFDANGGSVDEQSRSVGDGVVIGTLPIPTRTDYEFDGWYTDPAAGTKVTSSTVVNGNLDLYAHWSMTQSIEMNGQQYETLADAISNVPDNTPTTIRVIRDILIDDRITIGNKKNIIFDFQDNTVTNTSLVPVFENYGTITITNGKITTAGTQGAINNKSDTAHIIMTGGIIEATGTRQAIYIEKGTVDISGTAYLVAESTERATVQVQSNGKLNITGGTIVSKNFSAVVNAGRLNIGTQGGEVSTSIPKLQGATYGVNNTGTFNFYDGLLRGLTKGINGNVTNVESGYQVTTGTQNVSGSLYKTAYLTSL